MKSPLVTEHAAALVPDAVRLDEVRVAAEQGTVLLVGGETGEAEQRQGLIAGPLGRQEMPWCMPPCESTSSIHRRPKRSKASIFAGSMTYSTTQVIMPQASGALPGRADHPIRGITGSWAPAHAVPRPAASSTPGLRPGIPETADVRLATARSRMVTRPAGGVMPSTS